MKAYFLPDALAVKSFMTTLILILKEGYVSGLNFYPDDSEPGAEGRKYRWALGTHPVAGPCSAVRFSYHLGTHDKG